MFTDVSGERSSLPEDRGKIFFSKNRGTRRNISECSQHRPNLKFRTGSCFAWSNPGCESGEQVADPWAQKACCRRTQSAVRAPDTDCTKQFIIVFVVNPICDAHAGVKSFLIIISSLFMCNVGKTYSIWSVGTSPGQVSCHNAVSWLHTVKY
jgi:hypothetical protein